MTCTVGISDGIADFLVAYNAQRKAKDRSSARIGLAIDLATMALDNGARDRQSDAHALGLGRDKGLKELRCHFRRYSRSGIGHADGDHAIFGGGCGNQQITLLAVLHGIDRISYQIQQDLLNLHLVSQYKIDRWIELKLYSHALILGSDQRQRACLLDQLLDALNAPLAFATRHEIPQPPDDLPGADRLISRLIDRIAQHRGLFV